MLFKNLSNTGIRISSIGFDALPLSLKRRPSEKESIQLIHRTLDLGINFIDTADPSCFVDDVEEHHNEKLIYNALKSYKGNFGGYSKSIEDIVVATKCGLNNERIRHGATIDDTNPEMIKKAIERSYKALGGQRPIKLWQLHCPSSKYPLESIIAPIKEAISSGLIQFVGVSNLNINQIEKVRRALHIVSVQNEYNPWNRGPEKNGIIAYCRQNNLTFIPWSPVGQGYLYKTTLIKFSRLKELAVKRNCSVYSLILAWIMHKSNDIVPVTWSLKFSHIEDSIKSLYVKLTYDDVETIDQALDMIMWIFKQRPM